MSLHLLSREEWGPSREAIIEALGQIGDRRAARLDAYLSINDRILGGLRPLHWTRSAGSRPTTPCARGITWRSSVGTSSSGSAGNRCASLYWSRCITEARILAGG